MNAANLASLLQETTVPDTQRIKTVTAELQKNYYSHPESVLLLIEVLSTHSDENIRQQAAVQAARLVPKYWGKLSDKSQKVAAREHLVQATIKEPSARCRHADARVIAAIADHEIEDGGWPDLVPFVFKLVNESDPAVRQTGSFIMYCIAEESPELFSDKMIQVLEVFHRLLSDADLDVRMNTMLAIGAILGLFSPEEDEEPVKALHAVIPSMVEVFKLAVQSDDEEKIGHAFEVFQQFLAYESALLGPFLKDLVQLMIDLASNTSADDEVRVQAITFVTHVVQYRRMKVQGIPEMGKQLTIQSMVILTEVNDDDDDDDLTPARAAVVLLDRLASELPPRQVIVPLLDAFPSFAQSEEPGRRRAGVAALGTVVEGAPDFISSQLKSIMPHVISLLNDSDVGVRHAALVGLARLADDVADELASEHQALMTALVKNLQAATTPTSDEKLAKKNIEIICSACSALDSLSEGLDTETMRAYGGDLVQHIGSLVGHDDYKVKIAAAGALGAVAESLGEEFKPYFEKTVQALGAYLTIKDSEEDLSLRSGVTDALGRIATAVGPEAFQPYVQDIMKASEEGLKLDNSRLRESSFILWSSLAKVYDKHFVPFLPGVFQALFDKLELEEEEIAIPLSEEDQAVVGTTDTIITNGKKIKIRNVGEDEEDEMEDDDDDDEDDWDDVGISSEALEKEVAVEVLGDVITHACGPQQIQEYLERAVEMLAPLVEHTYEGCRKAAISTLWRAYGRVWQIYEEETGSNWEPGLPLKQTPSPILIKLGEIVAKATLKVWADDSEREVITEVNRNIAATLKACGPAVLAQENMLEQTISMLGTIISRSHPCQQDLGDDDETQEVEGSSEYDWLVIDTALDVVIGLAQALGPQFHEVWKVFEKPILKFASSSEKLERSTGVGVIAECAANMAAEVTPYTGKLLTLLLKRLADTDQETKSNAAYAVGQLIYHSQDSATYLPQYGAIMQKLEPMLQVTEARMRDNALGCISRMILAHPDKVPLGEVLPILVDMLPLKEDFEENTPVFECIYKLYEQNEPTIQQLTPKILNIFEKVLSPPADQLEDETKLLIHKLIGVLHNAKPELFVGHEALLNPTNSS